jgi:hypothetical protein
LHITGGPAIDVYYPQIHRVTREVFVRGILDPESVNSEWGPSATSVTFLDWSWIERAEFLLAPPPPS